VAPPGHNAWLVIVVQGRLILLHHSADFSLTGTLSSDRAEQVLVQLGIAQPQPELIVLAQNLMSLELIGTIKQQRADFDFSAVLDDVDLWEHYLGVLEREEPSAVCETIDEFIAKASRLAAVSLAHPERAVTLGIPPSRTERRLVSWQIVLPGRGRTYRFRHDQLQEYLYARDAVEQALMPVDHARAAAQAIASAPSAASCSNGTNSP